ncbi:hypothetical protein Hypma_000646 [Hypsizygus marmoreus]|uniref:Uncharacterized protein n=1 Tax=Hypsizygus marmoreus TaxID=39966 RepID=A0A369JAB7_HYPMA|nr:hypothetical protein Hypma_000646 [Hypsizygus marmoreus]
MLSQRTQFVKNVSADREAVHLLQRATSAAGKHAFVTHLEKLATKLKITLRGSDLLRIFLSWCHDTKPLPTNLQAAIQARAHAEMQKRATKRAFIRRTNLDWKRSDRDAFLATIPIKTVKALKTPFPPVGHHIAISPSIVKKWHHHLAFGKQPDKRKRRLPIHLLNSSKLIADIAPSDSAIFKNNKGEIIGMVIRNFCPDEGAVTWADSIAEQALSLRKNIRMEDTGKLGEIIGMVIRNFCPDEGAVTWADSIAEQALSLRKNIRMEDTGKLVQIGYSAGSLSSPKFDWVKNLLSDMHSHDTLTKINDDDSSVFAFAWQQMRSLLPTPIIDDIDLYLNNTKIKRMDANGHLASSQSQRSFSVRIGDNEFDFHHAELAPPTGAFGQNYSRPIHYETQPHKYAASWTLSHNIGLPGGMHFYFAKYGIRVQAAPNTVIVWIPTDAHGTCLPNYHPNDNEPPLLQRGLAFVTSNRLPSVWQAYVDGHISHARALHEITQRSDERYG